MSLKAVVTLISSAEGRLGRKALLVIVDTFRRLAPKERKALICLLSKEEVAHALEIVAGVPTEDMEFVGQILDRVQQNGQKATVIRARPGKSGASRVRAYVNKYKSGDLVKSRDVQRSCHVTSVNCGWVMRQLVNHGILKRKKSGQYTKL